MKQQYIHYGSDHYNKLKFKKVIDSDTGNNKPIGGLWASPVDSKWGWVNWCIGNKYYTERLNKSFKFTLVNGSRVFHIRTFEDMFKLPYVNYNDKYDTICNCVVYDWLKVKQKYDAVELHMTENYPLFHDAFYCWDVDSIVILNPNIIREI
jgi:hypothetical protein